MFLRTKRQRLATELRSLRDQAGVSGRELAQRIGISQSKVSRIESGAAIPTASEVAAWVGALNVSEETRELLAALSEAAFTEVHTWQSALRGRAHLQDDIQELESLARTIRTFQPSVVPGLLQTAAYAQQVLAMFHRSHGGGDTSLSLMGRMDRQLVLFEEDRTFEFLVTEAALRWRPGPPRLLMAQLDRIFSLSTLENVSIGVIPLAVEAVANSTHAFVVFEVPDDEDGSETVVTVETVHANLTVQDADSVALYLTRWSLLRQMAIFEDDARAFLAELSAEMKAGP
ncbi:helix-turn-helix domain-containing protein [Nonomuraea sp. NPDC050540]|uniref:helix-turn-helix domain-containing protein n=1 Tax=Nonomuraea sp. NPDC050540 TaxID=3364367 RepID=UPI003787A75C